MQTHRDADHETLQRLKEALHEPADQERALDTLDERWRRLEREAEEMVQAGASTITAGEPGEKPLREWAAQEVHVRDLPCAGRWVQRPPGAGHRGPR